MSNITTPSPIIAKKLCAEARYGYVGAVAPGIDLVLAKNPKDYTGPGTNTYVVGDDNVWIIDPGPDCSTHIASVIKAVKGRNVEGVLVTHSHQDHSMAALSIAQKTGAKVYGFGALSPDVLALTEEDVDADFVPDIALADGHLVGAGDWQILAIHTPGHFPNHMAYCLPHKGIVFSGDHVMGWSTTVVVPPLGNMAEYLASLDKLEHVGAHLMLPSHGPEVNNPGGRIRDVREHRAMRQQQVEACVQKGVLEPAAIVAEIYDDLPERLMLAAKGCVEAHLEFMTHEKASTLLQPLASTEATL